MESRKARQVFGLILFVIAFLFYFLAFQGKEFATIENISAGYSDNGSILLTRSIPFSAIHYYVCGDLKSENPIWFQIYLYDDQRTVVGKGDITADIPPGNFCKELIPLSLAFYPGSFTVEIVFDHDVIGATDFRIVE